MAQVTMEGKEYIDLMVRLNKAEAEKSVLVDSLIKGELVVNKNSNYSKVSYQAMAQLPEDKTMAAYQDIRLAHVVECLEQNPEAVQLLFDEHEPYFKASTGSFGNYTWDGYILISEQSEKLEEMWQKLENGERLVENDPEVDEEE